MRIYFLLTAIILLGCVSFVSAQPRTIQVDLGSIRYEDGVVSVSIVMPKKKRRQKVDESASMIRDELVSKIIDEGIEKTPYNRRFDIEKSVKLDVLVRLLRADIQLYDVVVDKTMVYADCIFDIKHMEQKLIDNGYLKRFGI